MNERSDLVGHFRKWAEVKAGSTAYDTFDFAFFLNDLHPDLFEVLFGNLAGGDQFIARLNRLIADHKDLADLDIEKAGTDTNQLTVRPLDKNRLPPDALVAVAERDVAQRRVVLANAGKHDEVRAWEIRSFRYVEPENMDFLKGLRAPYPDPLNSVLLNSIAGGYPVSCLTESAYHLVGNSTAIQPWLLKPWIDLPVDFEPAYELWRGGGWYRFDEGVCYVGHTGRTSSH